MSDARATSAARTAAEERRIRWIVRIGVLLVRLLGATWRVRRVRPEAFDAPVRDRRPTVFVLWHGQLLPSLAYHRNTGIRVLISEHADGEIIARIAERLGFATVRGSTSRGAGRALIEMSRVLAEGGLIAVTPDGPRGPARSFAPGALVAAQRAGVDVVPLIAIASRGWRLKSWDRFLIPKPFSRVVFAYGERTPVGGDNPRAAAEAAPRFQALMDETEREAERALG